VVHRLGEHIEFLILEPVPILNADMIDAGADTEPDRLEARLAYQEGFVDRKIRDMPRAV
jgi:hypothetical protein